MIRRALVVVALVAGVAAAIVDRDALDVAQLAREVAGEQDHVTALELAQWIRDRRTDLRIVDVRDAGEFATYHLPRSERIPMESIASAALPMDATIVLVSDGGAHAAQAWVFLRALGHRNVFFLRGGIGEWIDEVMNPKQPTELTRYFGGMPRAEGEDSLDADALRRRGC